MVQFFQLYLLRFSQWIRELLQTVALSIFEMTSGVQSATDHFSEFAIFPFLIAAIISMNGLSIHMQVAVIAKSADISMRPYIFGRLWSIITRSNHILFSSFINKRRLS